MSEPQETKMMDIEPGGEQTAYATSPHNTLLHPCDILTHSRYEGEASDMIPPSKVPGQFGGT
jgi:hypothetical protein